MIHATCVRVDPDRSKPSARRAPCGLFWQSFAPDDDTSWIIHDITCEKCRFAIDALLEHGVLTIESDGRLGAVTKERPVPLPVQLRALEVLRPFWEAA